MVKPRDCRRRAVVYCPRRRNCAKCTEQARPKTLLLCQNTLGNQRSDNLTPIFTYKAATARGQCPRATPKPSATEGRLAGSLLLVCVKRTLGGQPDAATL